MEQAERLVQVYIASQDDGDATAIADSISSGESKLLQVIKALGPYLTSDQDGTRLNGVQLLSSVLAKLPENKVNSTSLSHLTTFYCDKLDDDPALVPTLNGLISLCKFVTFGDFEALHVMNALIGKIHMRAHIQSTRYLVFKLVDVLLNGFRSALKTMGEAFVAGWIRLASGEKDPRNLIVAFAIYRVVLIEFPITKHLDDLFDNTFCYLPITFRPPPNDPYGITTEDLVKALRLVVAASADFGPKAVPLFLDKLSLGSPGVRRDVLQTLAESLPIYGHEIAAKHGEALWKSLKIEIFQPTDPHTESDALAAIQSLIKTLYLDVSDESASKIQDLPKDICVECALILQEPEKNQAKAAIKVISTLILTTKTVTKFALEQIMPFLIQRFLHPENQASRQAILTCFGQVFHALEKADDAANLLAPYKDQLLAAMTIGLKETSSRESAISAMLHAVKLAGLLTAEELRFAVHVVNDVTFADSFPESSWSGSIDLLKQIGSMNSSSLEDLTLPTLFDSLPDVPPPKNDSKRRDEIWKVLRALEDLCAPSPLFQILVVRLFAKIDVVCGYRFHNPHYTVASDLQGRDERAAYVHAMLLTLEKVLERKVKSKDPDVSKYVRDLEKRLLGLLVLSAAQDHWEGCVATHEKIVETGSQIGSLIVGSLSESQQTLFFDLLYTVFVDGAVDKLVSAPAIGFHPFAPSASMAQKNSTRLFFSCISASLPTTIFPIESLNSFVSSRLTWALEVASNNEQATATHQAVGALVNKLPDELYDFVSLHSSRYWEQGACNHEASITMRRRGIEGWLWITKGLGCRGHPQFFTFVDKLFDLFADDDVAWDAGRSMGLLGGNDPVLSKQNHAVVKLLHAQKFVNRIMPRVIEMAEGPKSTQNTAALVALTTLLKSVSKAIYQAELPKLLPLLLKALDLPNKELQANVIETLQEACHEPDVAQLIAEYATSLLQSILRLIVDRTASAHTNRVRIAALRFLAHMPEFVRYDILHPQKKAVLKALGSLLDDPKRSIRQEVVEARSAWYRFHLDG